MLYLTAEKTATSYHFIIHTDETKLKDVTQRVEAVFETIPESEETIPATVDGNGNEVASYVRVTPEHQVLVSAAHDIIVDTIPDPDYVKEFNFGLFNPENPPLKISGELVVDEDKQPVLDENGQEQFQGREYYTEAEYIAMIRREMELLVEHHDTVIAPPVAPTPLEGFI